MTGRRQGEAEPAQKLSEVLVQHRVTDRGPLFIDINPRLVEPVNALRSGVDLTEAMIEVSRSGSAPPQPAGPPGVRTHQLLLAVLGAAQHGGRRRDVAGTLWQAMTRTADYRGSTEELTPAWSVPVIAATLATMVSPASWRHFAGAPRAYSLTPASWQELLDHAEGLRLGPALTSLT